MTNPELTELFDRPDQIKQTCILLFEAEREKKRAYIDSNRAPRFLSRKAFSKYYKLSEHLRNVSEKDYKSMRKFMIHHWYEKDQKI